MASGQFINKGNGEFKKNHVSRQPSSISHIKSMSTQYFLKPSKNMNLRQEDVSYNEDYDQEKTVVGLSSNSFLLYPTFSLSAQDN